MKKSDFWLLSIWENASNRKKSKRTYFEVTNLYNYFALRLVIACYSMHYFLSCAKTRSQPLSGRRKKIRWKINLRSNADAEECCESGYVGRIRIRLFCKVRSGSSYSKKVRSGSGYSEKVWSGSAYAKRSYPDLLMLKKVGSGSNCSDGSNPDQIILRVWIWIHLFW